MQILHKCIINAITCFNIPIILKSKTLKSITLIVESYLNIGGGETVWQIMSVHAKTDLNIISRIYSHWWSFDVHMSTVSCTQFVCYTHTE